VLALLANERLYVAACGDCRCVLGSFAEERGSERMVAHTMIKDHNCKNTHEIQLVRERSKDAKVSPLTFTFIFV
jgi:serine/threonine protein phosphatase PrpC